MKKNKITVFDGQGKLAGKGKVAVDQGRQAAVADLTGKHIILATGARARALPGLEPDGKLVWTYQEAMVPPAMPKSLLVIGSGAIGIEFASFYRNMGAEVTVVEVLDRVLPVEDEEISAFARKAFEKQGMKIYTGAAVKALKKQRQFGDGDDRGRRASASRSPPSASSWRSASSAMSRISASKAPRSRSRRPISSSTSGSPPTSRASMRSATSSGRPGSRTRRAMRASSASRRSPGSTTSIRSTPATSRAAPIACRRSPASA